MATIEPGSPAAERDAMRDEQRNEMLDERPDEKRAGKRSEKRSDKPRAAARRDKTDKPDKPDDARMSEERSARVAGLESYGRLYGSSAVMQDLYEQIRRVSVTEATALIVGESGTGKELVARTIHEESNRRDGPFIAVNCGAIPDELIEAELFGHEKGSFTGAVQARDGHFEHARGGTLFLDEVTEMSLLHQVKLLRALESGEYYPVGSNEAIRGDVRVIAATNRDPVAAVRDMALREDLMYRLAVFPLRAPPLRERERDRELLAQLFLNELNDESGTQKVFSKRALETVRNWSWPGNVRELKNAVYRAFILAEKQVEIAHPQLVPRVKKPVTQGDAMSVWIGTPLADAQKQIILGTLKHCGGDKRLAARTLGVSLKTLYNRLGSYGAEDGDAPPPEDIDSDEGDDARDDA
ncbi:DNA-binding NtrC family response regulator [Paraburkholderia tropica]|uniref:Fis family sigma54 specific transcriptional regulator n=2 Tax=Burkholderiaceae TaxID=119060 RepID=A0ABX5MT09_9BURK|nr:DNA-binding NtrC family response regulator [Paraburkholderia tropica]MBB6319296.1 DNA-binding NtrC family response regulator [Paraburkholderia tropica]PXX16336.1 Fis family sigma54 specific transcriptional regulator [Paraburkholderia tropica]PZW82728.1 Fis family sigma54 specific transcriptional regulator [Paraburkholderia tropica]